MEFPILNNLFSKNILDVAVSFGRNNSFVLSAKHDDRNVKFSSHHPVLPEFTLPNAGAVTLHENDLVHSEFLHIERDNGDILKLFQCPNNTFTVVELVKKPYFSLVLARRGKSVVVDGIDFSNEASKLLLKGYTNLFKRYKKILNVSKYKNASPSMVIEI